MRSRLLYLFLSIEAIFEEGTMDVMTWLETIGESIIVTEEEVETLTDVNVKLKRVEEADNEMEIKRKQIQDLKVTMLNNIYILKSLQFISKNFVTIIKSIKCQFVFSEICH